MARSPLANRLREGVSVVAEANHRGVELDRIVEERRTTRRTLLRDAGALGAATIAAGSWTRLAGVARAGSAPRIAIVGAGLAGLTCAYRLKQAGVVAQLYEAHATRLGGRCWTIRSFADGQLGEHGGELIDQGHTELRHLAQELGLSLDNLLQAEPNGTEDFFYVNGARYPNQTLLADLNGIYQQLHRDTIDAGYPTLWNSYTPRGFALDHMSIIEWLNATVPGGAASNLGRVLDIAYNIEFGAESNVQSSLNLIYLLGFAGQGQFRIFGRSNEKYHIQGGNDQVPTRLGQALASQITMGAVLTSIKLDSGGTYTLTFKRDSGTLTVTADHVVLALPFSILRSSVSYSKAGFEPLKITAIQELGMGTNSKLHVQFADRYWYGLGNNGNTFADTGYQNTWEVTRAQPGRKGILVDYTGGTIGASFGTGTASSRAQQFLAQIEPVLPGIAAHWIPDAATVDFWTAYPWTKGSYSYWKVGQYTKFAGIERARQGNCHFAGEHTSIDFQGYLNGGVESGERVATEILGDLAKG